MKKRVQRTANATGGMRGAGIARTGDHCPVNGWWAPLNDGGRGLFITEGSVMPSVSGTPTGWQLTPSNLRHVRHDVPPHDFALDLHQPARTYT